jgi:hypothetical protein
MFPDGSAREIKHGFIGIETAELMRQQATVAKFRAEHAGEYRALVEATIALKRAHQGLENAKSAARSLPTGLPMSDLLDEVEREARAALLETTKDKLGEPTAAQIEQQGDSASTPEPTKKGQKAA